MLRERITLYINVSNILQKYRFIHGLAYLFVHLGKLIRLVEAPNGGSHTKPTNIYECNTGLYLRLLHACKMQLILSRKTQIIGYIQYEWNTGVYLHSLHIGSRI